MCDVRCDVWQIIFFRLFFYPKMKRILVFLEKDIATSSVRFLFFLSVCNCEYKETLTSPPYATTLPMKAKSISQRNTFCIQLVNRLLEKSFFFVETQKQLSPCIQRTHTDTPSGSSQYVLRLQFIIY